MSYTSCILEVLYLRVLGACDEGSPKEGCRLLSCDLCTQRECIDRKDENKGRTQTRHFQERQGGSPKAPHSQEDSARIQARRLRLREKFRQNSKVIFNL